MRVEVSMVENTHGEFIAVPVEKSLRFQSKDMPSQGDCSVHVRIFAYFIHYRIPRGSNSVRHGGNAQ